MFYTMYVRVGNEVRIGYFFLSFKKPFWISRKADWYINDKSGEWHDSRSI